jgi:hypothetical protein
LVLQNYLRPKSILHLVAVSMKPYEHSRLAKLPSPEVDFTLWVLERTKLVVCQA